MGAAFVPSPVGLQIGNIYQHFVCHMNSVRSWKIFPFILSRGSPDSKGKYWWSKLAKHYLWFHISLAQCEQVGSGQGRLCLGTVSHSQLGSSPER